MKFVKLNLIVCVMAVALGVPMGTLQARPAVTVNVTAQTEAGAPLSEVPLVVHAPSSATFGFTDAAGHLSVEVDVATGDDEINVALNPGGRFNLPVAQRILAADKYKQFTEGYSFDLRYRVAIVPGTISYNISVIGHESIEVTGTIMNQTHFERESMVQVRGGEWMARVPLWEQFHVHGVRKGVAGELCFDLEGDAVYCIQLTATQTQGNVDLGQLVFPIYQSDSVANITVQNFADKWWPGKLVSLGRSVTLISSDGQKVLSFPVESKTGKVVADIKTVAEKASPSVPAGTYYILPSIFAGSPAHWKILDALRTGHQADLDAHNVPKITTVAGQTASLTVDAVQARDAILAATGG